MVTCITGLVVSQDLAVTPAEVRRLAAEEGSLAKKTWLRKIEERQRLGELQCWAPVSRLVRRHEFSMHSSLLALKLTTNCSIFAWLLAPSGLVVSWDIVVVYPSQLRIWP